jgi:hypothetical protein
VTGGVEALEMLGLGLEVWLVLRSLVMMIIGAIVLVMMVMMVRLPVVIWCCYVHLAERRHARRKAAVE